MENNFNDEKIAVIAITKKGLSIAKEIKNTFTAVDIYVPKKFSSPDYPAIYFDRSVTQEIEYLFNNYHSLICIFSLGAVIRLISPHIKDKKTDPAVIVIDDASKFVISTLSGHLGGANDLTLLVSKILNAIPVITTAADVNNTISVDLVGKKLGWVIDDYKNVTKVSAMMVNEDKIGVFQDAGEKDWLSIGSMPKNVEIVDNLTDLKTDKYNASLIITDKLITDDLLLTKSVVYRPKTLVVGIGLHWTTSKETIETGIKSVLEENQLSFKSIRCISSIDKGRPVRGLDEFCKDHNLDLLLYSKEKLGEVKVPNPSELVGKYEGTASVSEASSLIASNGGFLLVPKKKFPPDLTVAISKINVR
ncbi:MAG: cobalamin biosynthesis protein [Thermoproteota archaeon]|nr:cobalamin biosynthesis protein [Thermoproteota archaeon]